MAKKYTFQLVSLFFFVLVVGFLIKNTLTESDESAISPEAYQQQVDAERQKKDTFFKTDTNSPIIDKAAFKHLIYYGPNLNYRVSARLETFADVSQKMVVHLSDGSEEVYEKYAHAVFELNGRACRLLITKTNGNYTVLFRDSTSGKTTYGGGRYLDLSANDLTSNRATLDFNAAYNPYCAYNASYACPLPPAENTLLVAVEAGEKQAAGH
jgi:uncharacterized protein